MAKGLGIGGASMLALAAAMLALPATAFAQVAAAPAPQEPAAVPTQDATADDIVVTGIRGSLSSAAAQKRMSTVVQDSISSEDLGKFPDANVAESLQRVPGVSIDRSDGEGRFVTVRGFGPAFNTVLVNGRTFASDNSGREFSFDVLPAELISGADVYKTSQAKIQDGGIGSTINMKTFRPLDNPGTKIIASAKGNYETKSEKIAPQLFGLISTTGADGDFGIMGAVSYQQRKNITDTVQANGYLADQDVGPPGAQVQNVYTPRNLDSGRLKQNRQRVGVNVTAQYRTSDDVLFTVDALYNKFTVDSDNRSLGSWFEPASYVAGSVQLDENRTVTSLTTNGNADLINSSYKRDSYTKAIAFNANWQPSDQLTVILDSAFSQAGNDNGGKSFFTVAGIPSTYTYVGQTGKGFGSVTHSADLLNPAAVRTHQALRSGSDTKERVWESKLDTEWKGEGTLKAVRMGLIATLRRKAITDIGTQDVSCLYCGYPTLADPSLFSPVDFGSFINADGNVPTKFLSYDPDAYLASLETASSLAALDRAQKLPPGTSAARIAASGGYAARPGSGATRLIENVYSGYVDTDFEGMLGGVPWFLNVGARYMHTSLRSSGLERTLLDIRAVPNDPTIYEAVFTSPTATPVTKTSSYDFLLPSLNLKISLAENVVARFGASRTVTRPQIGDLAPRTAIGTVRPVELSASGGNPDLKPYQATNLDLSFEWYPTSTTTLSAAAFYKNVQDYIIQLRADEVFPILNAGNPAAGIAPLTPGGNNPKITGANQATFGVLRPQNSDLSANIHGLELNVIHSFDWAPGALSGFGVQMNATFVKTNRSFDGGTSQDVIFATEGLGNSQNATLFYEKYGLSARIAYNRRERFLLNLVNPGYGREPVFTRTYGQADARISYDFTPKLQVFGEGTNIFNAKNITTGRFDNQLLTFADYGARYAIGVRANF